jgi:hypothetical protein
LALSHQPISLTVSEKSTEFQKLSGLRKLDKEGLASPRLRRIPRLWSPRQDLRFLEGKTDLLGLGNGGNEAMRQVQRWSFAAISGRDAFYSDVGLNDDRTDCWSRGTEEFTWAVGHRDMYGRKYVSLSRFALMGFAFWVKIHDNQLFAVFATPSEPVFSLLCDPMGIFKERSGIRIVIYRNSRFCPDICNPSFRRAAPLLIHLRIRRTNCGYSWVISLSLSFVVSRALHNSTYIFRHTLQCQQACVMQPGRYTIQLIGRHRSKWPFLSSLSW